MSDGAGEGSGQGGIIRDWWRESIRAETGAARALAARLRRADRPSAVLAAREVVELARRLSLRDPDRAALIAQTVAAVKEDAGAPLARRFGRGDPPPLSPLRFQKLIRSDDPQSLARTLRRAIPLVGGSCDVGRLGADLFWWGEAVRARWCFEYFGQQAPDAETSESEESEA